MTRATKRKRSLSELLATSCRKKTYVITHRKAGLACPLVQTLLQYGLLETIVSCLTPSELLSLALACKATYNAILPRTASLENLLSKIPCCGSGITLRQHLHVKSSFFYQYECTEFAQCRTASGRHSIESRSCVSCKVTTCDECRIHCVYQSIYEAPADPGDLPNFSGFVMLDPFEVGILSPHHLASEPELSEAASLPKWRDRATNATAGPYHDQGFLDVPLQFEQGGTPEKISDVINLDLGYNSLTAWSGTSQFGFPSPVLRSLCTTAEQRKLFLCEWCFTDARKGYNALSPKLPKLSWLDGAIEGFAKEALQECHCSLRTHVLDRWQCIKCFGKEESIIENIHSMAPDSQYQECRCGQPASKIVCMWCWGEVVERSDAIEQAAFDNDESERAEEEDSSEED
ncbi:hypothetical protein SVAN01_03941 [Stagonosporopsis vannaccii]|nr:hypothetical protein SVAN01_03941 [Stagonosporopsis vannaccii]